ncbi:NAD(P)-dependent oxidoreductase [Rickettsiales bacterium]|nr:NAD(P)-dependent oxidoreductase [Rickettsiales bacterium]
MSKPLPKEDLSFIEDSLKGIIHKFDNKHIFITGASGFIGSWILESLLSIIENQKLKTFLTILTRDKNNFLSNYPFLNNPKILHIIESDILDFNPDMIIKPVDYIIHAASETDNNISQKNPILFSDIIVKGSRNVLELAKAHKGSKIIFLSSGAVYGKNTIKKSGFSEDDNTGPDCGNCYSSYSESKRYAELLFSLYNKEFQIKYVIARCFAFIGPRLPLDAHFAIGNFINDIIKKQDITISGDGMSVRSYLYTADLVMWLFQILLEGKSGSTYNVGSNEYYTIAETAQEVIKANNSEQSFKILHKNSNNNIYIPNIDKISTELQLRPTYKLSDSIVKTIKWNINELQ